MFLFLSIGTYSISSITKTDAGRKLAAIVHGIAILAILVAGFGMLARLNLIQAQGWPLWVWVKMIIWILLGASLFVIKRNPKLAPVLWFIIPLLGGIAAYMAINQVE